MARKEEGEEEEGVRRPRIFFPVFFFYLRLERESEEGLLRRSPNNGL
jgi:hypothetical protein